MLVVIGGVRFRSITAVCSMRVCMFPQHVGVILKSLSLRASLCCAEFPSRYNARRTLLFSPRPFPPGEGFVFALSYLLASNQSLGESGFNLIPLGGDD